MSGYNNDFGGLRQVVPPVYFTSAGLVCRVKQLLAISLGVQLF